LLSRRSAAQNARFRLYSYKVLQDRAFIVLAAVVVQFALDTGCGM
jgi:hypothetical protein